MISCIWGYLKSPFAQKCFFTLLLPFVVSKTNVYKVVISFIIISFKKKRKQTNKQTNKTKSVLYNQTRKPLKPYSIL